MKLSDIKTSSGVPAQMGDLITIQYEVALTDSDLDAGEFIEERNENNPIEVRLSTDQLLASLVDAIVGMKDGGSIRRVSLEADEAFGVRGLHGRIPSNAPVVFQIWLRKVVRG